MIQNKMIRDVAFGPQLHATEFSMYFVNGYRFQTVARSFGRATDNSGVSISTGDMDYYGRITDIFEIEYPGAPTKRCTFFNVTWFDPTPGIGTRTDERLNIMEVNKNRRLSTLEPYILAQQAVQVAYLTYPGAVGSRADWLVASTVRPRGWVVANSRIGDDEAYQDEYDEPILVSEASIDATELVDGSSIREEVQEEHPDNSEESLLETSSDEYDSSSDSDYGISSQCILGNYPYLFVKSFNIALMFVYAFILNFLVVVINKMFIYFADGR